MIFTKSIKIKTKGECSILDISKYIEDAVSESKLNNGIITVFVTGSTAAISTIEYEEGLLDDFSKVLERIAPRDAYYKHEERWHDDNGHSHIRASLIGSSLTIPFINKEVMLGRWQQVILIELDTKPRDRNIIIQIMGE
ncbi:MAG: secondary thiamine-phosphate synthase enzyme YjbQ [Candidatus Nitrosocaldaceae archaeon]